MPYFRGNLDRDRDRFPEEVNWVLAMSHLKSVTSVQEPQNTIDDVLLTAPDMVEREDINWKHMEGSKRLGREDVGMLLTTLSTLVEHDPKDGVAQFLRMYGVHHVKVPIQKNKPPLKATVESVCEALLFIMNPMNHPVYIHCNMGKHRTGCVVACLRKCQQWPIDETLAEYRTYADDKAREADIEFIKAFDPVCVHEYAKMNGYLDIWPRQDSAADIWELAALLPAHELSQIPKDDFDEDDEDDIDDEDCLTIKRSPVVDISNHVSLSRQHSHSSIVDITAIEVDEHDKFQFNPLCAKSHA